MVVEDRYGNKVTFNEDGDIIEDDGDGDGDDNPEKILSSSRNTLNILLLLSFILFLN